MDEECAMCMSPMLRPVGNTGRQEALEQRGHAAGGPGETPGPKRWVGWRQLEEEERVCPVGDRREPPGWDSSRVGARRGGDRRRWARGACPGASFFGQGNGDALGELMEESS